MTETSVPPPRNGMAVAALILGILAILLAPFLIGLFLGITALILGIVALRRPARRGLAIAGIVTGGLSIPIAMVMVPIVILLPALAAARMAARESRAAVNLRTISVAAQMYTAEWNAPLPPHIAYFAPYGDLSRFLNDPRLNTPPYVPTPGADLKTRMAEIDAHCDFYYAGAGVFINRLPHPATFILLYDRPGAGRHRVVVFADGHVEQITPGPAIERLVDENNKQRAALKLPPLPLDLSGPPAPPAPPAPER